MSMDYVRWAERYDIFYEAAPPGEKEFYLNEIRRIDGSVLELGVGTGRIAIPAAAMGCDITGVDLNRPMLDRAREKSDAAPFAGNLTLIEGDIAELNLPKREFDLVIIPANTLALITEKERQLESLRRCAAHMAADAALIFNVFNPSPDLIHDAPGEKFLLGVVKHPGTGRRSVLTGVNRFEVEAQINRCTQAIETIDANGAVVDREELSVVFRYLHHEEICEMLHQAGLRVIEVYGDFDGTPLSDDSEEMVYRCRLA